MAMKVLSSSGVPTVINYMKANHTAIHQLSDALSQSVSEIEDIINDYPVNNSATLLVNSWQTDNNSTNGYNYYYDISCTIDSNDLPIVSVSLSSLSIATAAEICPVCQSLTNAIRMYAKNLPTENITVGYFIIQGQAAT